MASASPNPAATLRKRLVVCFDGTWNNADAGGGDTNVALISRAIHATTDTGGLLQSVLYLRGVGTTGLHADRVLEGATGLGIDDNIRSGYMFLAQNYVPGDEIFLFGFSRGAFTARSLVGLVSAVGLLKRQSLGALGEAWNYYRTPKPHSPAAFSSANPGVNAHLDVEIAFLGVWDTVGALGIPGHLLAPVNSRLYGFYDTGACRIVRRACHALAIDEHRDAFVPTLWTGEAPERSIIEQVWFAGAHADVGGGYADRRLADIPLLFMARRAAAAGLALDWSCLPSADHLDPCAQQHDSSEGVFMLNRLVPTFRRVCGQSFDVPFYQRLYAPLGSDGRPVPTIGEAVHASVLARHGRDVRTERRDGEQGTVRAYSPPNLAALLAAGGGARSGIEVAS